MSDKRTYFKVVDHDGYTRRGLTGETRWLPVGVLVRPTGRGSAACGPGVLHLYGSAIEAELYNPIHANITTPQLLQVEVLGDKEVMTDGLKHWTTASVKTVAVVDRPKISMEQRVAWAICIAPHSSPRVWAIGWLLGVNRAGRTAWASSAVWAAGAAWAGRTAASVDEPKRLSYRSLAAYERAELILAGKFPAENYDSPL